MDTSSTKPRRSARTPDRILDVAQRLMQTRGYNGFSYADVAAEIGVRKASLHHHFSTKAALGAAVIARYTARIAEALAEIDAGEPDAAARLVRYTRLYTGVLTQGRLCLGAMLAAEIGTLPQPMQAAVRKFFQANLAWLEAVIERGRSTGALAPQGTDAEAARVLLCGLEGAMLIARPLKDIKGFRVTARALLAGLGRRG